jgi:hypothetical protein
MNSFLSQTVSIKSCLGAIAVVCTLLISGTTLYWSTEVREAVKVEQQIQEKREFEIMKAQLTRIESGLASLTFEVKKYHP